MQQKKGAAHFEMIVAFLLFTGFVIFIFTIIRPYESTTLSEAVLEGMFDSLEKETQTNHTELYLKITNTQSGCIEIELPKKLITQGITQSILKDINGNTIDSNTIGENLTLEHTATHYRLTLSPDLDDGDTPVGCTGITTEIEYGSVTEKKLFSKQKLETLEQQYFTNYNGLKKDLNIPNIYDYSIQSEKLNINMQGVVADSGEILSKQYIIEVLDYNNGNIINADITLKVW